MRSVWFWPSAIGDETEAIAFELTRESGIPITFLSLSRNFGEHNAVLAGLRASTGR